MSGRFWHLAAVAHGWLIDPSAAADRLRHCPQISIARSPPCLPHDGHPKVPAMESPAMNPQESELQSFGAGGSLKKLIAKPSSTCLSYVKPRSSPVL